MTERKRDRRPYCGASNISNTAILCQLSGNFVGCEQIPPPPLFFALLVTSAGKSTQTPFRVCYTAVFPASLRAHENMIRIQLQLLNSYPYDAHPHRCRWHITLSRFAIPGKSTNYKSHGQFDLIVRKLRFPPLQKCETVIKGIFFYIKGSKPDPNPDDLA